MTRGERLRARVSPDFDAYASGQLPATKVRCVLCGKAPCRCVRCAEHDVLTAYCGCVL